MSWLTCIHGLNLIQDLRLCILLCIHLILLYLTTLSINNIILNLKERDGKFNYQVALRGQNSFSILSDNLIPILTTIKHRK